MNCETNHYPIHLTDLLAVYSKQHENETTDTEASFKIEEIDESQDERCTSILSTKLSEVGGHVQSPNHIDKKDGRIGNQSAFERVKPEKSLFLQLVDMFGDGRSAQDYLSANGFMPED
ncbi:unnamed protein product [Caenorhabditis bovis]|uniref:Uncharacterized protein n=1 Tax=Caenorhabditis bovis TaxID=2654633 RepID=A0A8S1F3G9_9PELO|nr:unnamed protein product [Caenorhabditis bovis]